MSTARGQRDWAQPAPFDGWDAATAGAVVNTAGRRTGDPGDSSIELLKKVTFLGLEDCRFCIFSCHETSKEEREIRKNNHKNSFCFVRQPAPLLGPITQNGYRLRTVLIPDTPAPCARTALHTTIGRTHQVVPTSVAAAPRPRAPRNRHHRRRSATTVLV